MEFKKLSDVEVVAEPAETANVLIEEDGVIKKAPKTAVGGGGEWDAVIRLGDSSGWADNLSNASFISGDYDTLYEIISSGEYPRVLIQMEWSYGDTYYDVFIPYCYSANLTTPSVDMYLIIETGSYRLSVSSDGTFSYASI